MNSLKLLIFSIWALLREAVSVLQQRAISDQWYLMPRFWLKLFQMLTRLQRPPWPSRPRLWLPPWCFASSKLIIFYPHKNCFFLVFSISFLLVGFFFVFLSLPYFWNFFVGLFVEWGKQLEQEQQVTSNSLSFSISLFLWIFSFFLFFFFVLFGEYFSYYVQMSCVAPHRAGNAGSERCWLLFSLLEMTAGFAAFPSRPLPPSIVDSSNYNENNFPFPPVWFSLSLSKENLKKKNTHTHKKKLNK